MILYFCMYIYSELLHMKNIVFLPIIKNLVAIFIITLVSVQCNFNKQNPEISQAAVYDHTYSTLDSTVQNTKRQLINYLQHTQSNAGEVVQDDLVKSFFKTQKAFEAIKDKSKLPKSTLAKKEKLELAFRRHYINKYQRFYDILMVDTSGNIFYTIKKEADYHQNIFTPEFRHTPLSRKLKSDIKKSLVDFRFYEISGEPSAFFIEPFYENGKFLGWIVMQFSVSKINHIFSLNKHLGQSGEVILVNKAHYMLTDSRFKPQSTILQKKLASNNIESKFALGKGHKQVTDYMGFDVISAFEVFSFMNNEWLIIAKINEAEVRSNFYLKNPDSLKVMLLKYIEQQKHHYLKYRPVREAINVNIDEFKRGKSGEVLYTHGISTCSGLIISLKQDFAYMAHISPYDKIYGETRTDMLSQLLNRINYLEITRAQKKLLRFKLITPNKHTAVNVVNTLLKKGIMIDQIQIVMNPDASKAAISHFVERDSTVIHWQHPNSSKKVNEYVNPNATLANMAEL